MDIVVIGPVMEPVCNAIFLATKEPAIISVLARIRPMNATAPAPAAEPAMVQAAASTPALQSPAAVCRIVII